MVLELWFDFSCPYAYLASRRAPALARACGVPLVYKPMLLGGVFRGIGSGDGPNATLGPAKAAHNAHDMQRFAELSDVPFRMPAAHPMRTVRALRTLLALPHSRWPAAIDALYAAYWQRGEDVTQDAVIAAALRDAGASDADIADALRRADDDAIKAELHARTDEAIALGIFGAPGWIVRDGDRTTLVWGQDRIAFVEAILCGWRADEDAPPGGPRPLAHLPCAFTSPSTLDVYFDVGSPFAYLGLTQLPALAERCGIVPRLVPILVGALFRAVGQVGVPLDAFPAAKRAYVLRDAQRWARWWGEPLAWPRKFPQRTVTAQRLCVIAAAERGFADAVRLAIALGRAMWAEQQDLEDDATLAAILDATGLPAAWLGRASEPEIKAALVAHTSAAQAAGAFGVPTFVVDGRYLFWGQDRLELVMRALGGWRPAHG